MFCAILKSLIIKHTWACLKIGYSQMPWCIIIFPIQMASILGLIPPVHPISRPSQTVLRRFGSPMQKRGLWLDSSQFVADKWWQMMTSFPRCRELESLNTRWTSFVLSCFVFCHWCEIWSISDFSSSLRWSAQFYRVAMVGICRLKMVKLPAELSISMNIMGTSWEHNCNMGISWLISWVILVIFHCHDEDIESFELIPKWYLTYQYIPQLCKQIRYRSLRASSTSVQWHIEP